MHHWVNYDIDFTSGNARPTEPIDLTVTLPAAVPAEEAVWLTPDGTGQPLGYVPNEKGLRRDEFVVSLPLRSGEKMLVVKLQRFWERRWLFYASLTEG